ncbi:prepilin-type N-terminal cleavage/methylation domain-containing protein [Coraliomargarita algicola]|uniref:Prepilin-type N-terminal cleavage/methylation domain-containing protein n=1 Tax=Coraliomargarita algicola TaxID=3092156 RepID=A0ABZ0RET5_9BACT|nr:prepilin-type N-terminal cleavage/methylation domain-containing protein [Coraliomargarita sp. J2-16]WPJ94517.1 prepilin-type N-terminal cleavage/methylation domain-containing protein [Coraliomargarita sp. J2-16]
MASTAKYTFYNQPGGIRGASGFTLAELLVSISITLLVSTAVLTFFVSFAKASLAMSSYSEFEQDNRKLLQYFSQDVRDAEAVLWTSDQCLTLISKGVQTSYVYDALLQTVVRTTPGEPSQEMAQNLSTLTFCAYDKDGESIRIASNTSAANSETKMIQVIGRSSRTLSSGANTSADLISARYMMRNKVILTP